MNYFTFSEILIGIVSFVFCGFFLALATESIKLFLSFKNEIPGLVCHLYKSRTAFFGHQINFVKTRNNQFDSEISDFLSVILFVLTYLFVSYLCFDGIFRGAYFLILLFSYFFCAKYLLRPYSYILARIAHGLLNSLAFIAAPWIFLLNKLILVLKLPLWGIIGLIRSFVLLFLSAKRTERMVKKISAACKKMLEIRT